MKELVFYIGAFTIAVIAAFSIIVIKDGINDLISKLKWRHKYKHRFDKPPTAKCYCKDCWYWWPDSGKCCAFGGLVTADDWFCWNAKPTDYDQEKEK